jgi:YggT family protein
MSFLLAVTRADVGEYVRILTYVYFAFILVRILMSWIPQMPYNRVLDMVLTFVRDVTDPYLNLFRRFLPPVRIGPGALDLSPIIATIVLLVVGELLATAIAG